MGSGKSSLLYESMTDEELLALASAGDLQAEETMIRRYSRVVRSLARPFFLTGGDQEDLLQEGMLGLLSAIRGYDAGKNASFRTFAMLCIRRRLISAVRESAGTQNVSLDDCLSLESSLFDELSSRNDNMRGPEELLIDREESQKRYQNLLQRLSAFEQSVLRCFLRGMSYREIAKTTNRSEKAVDNAVQRIRRKFQKLTPGDTSFG
ncbi:MAG: sigma-70 family RNA polymerase sigma factor [Oscillospiraceae bacterium]|nr:sigma-70 family RNA polymerase sigma factor [Oscillospiraceae bacterium]